MKAPGSIRPVLTYSRTGKPNDPNCAVTGGYVVRDPELPSLEGRYLYGDFCRGQIRSFELRGGRARDDRPIGLTVPRLDSFGEDAGGRPVRRLAGWVRLSPHGRLRRPGTGSLGASMDAALESRTRELAEALWRVEPGSCAGRPWRSAAASSVGWTGARRCARRCFASSTSPRPAAGRVTEGPT